MWHKTSYGGYKKKEYSSGAFDLFTFNLSQIELVWFPVVFVKDSVLYCYGKGSNRREQAEGQRREEQVLLIMQVCIHFGSQWYSGSK